MGSSSLLMLIILKVAGIQYKDIHFLWLDMNTNYGLFIIIIIINILFLFNRSLNVLNIRHTLSFIYLFI